MDWRTWMAETPFGSNTRQNYRNINAFTYSQGNRESQAFPRTGYLARCDWHFTGTCTVTLGGGTANPDVLGPWNTFGRVRINANSGTDIYNTSGYGNYLVNRAMMSAESYDPAKDALANSLSYASQVFGALTAAGANTWEFGLTVPVALNDMSEMGLVLLQNELASVSLNFEYNSLIYSLTAAQAPVLVTGAATATLTGSIVPAIEYFSVPQDPNARPDITWLHQILEQTKAIGALGDNTIDHLRENLYVQILNHFIMNNTPNTTDIDRVRLTFNNSDTPYDVNKRSALQRQRRVKGSDLPLGCYLWDFNYQGFAGYGGQRDIINGKATSELQTIYTVNSAATLGTNASRVNTITRQLVRLSAPPVAGV